jgi:subtilisin-like proprotein convertase family protein
LLIPEIPGQTPGITVAPRNGLTTTESGGQASFGVQLTTAPTANVTIGISSSDTTEGTVDVASLTFTPANWNLSHTVTITGVEDLDADGNVEYTIITTAATSADPKYNGLNASDVQVTNLDDEQAPILVYHSTDTPLAIPDPGTRASLIVVNENFLVGNVTVKVNIDHNRAQDMDVFLIAPNERRVELFTDVGGNGDDFIDTTLHDQATLSITQGSAPFTGSFRPEGRLSDFVLVGTQGTWRLEVTDYSSTGGQNAAGTLLGWTLTIEAL